MINIVATINATKFPYTTADVVKNIYRSYGNKTKKTLSPEGWEYFCKIINIS